MDAGAEMLIFCRGGRATVKRQTYPPALEIEEADGMYVLDDTDDSPGNWAYVFVSEPRG